MTDADTFTTRKMERTSLPTPPVPLIVVFWQSNAEITVLHMVLNVQHLQKTTAEVGRKEESGKQLTWKMLSKELTC